MNFTQFLKKHKLEDQPEWVVSLLGFAYNAGITDYYEDLEDDEEEDEDIEGVVTTNLYAEDDVLSCVPEYIPSVGCLDDKKLAELIENLKHLKPTIKKGEKVYKCPDFDAWATDDGEFELDLGFDDQWIVEEVKPK